MNHEQLQAIGLSDVEARVYLAVLMHPQIGAQRIAELSGTPRTSVYPVARSLVARRLLETVGVGYGTRYLARPPKEALPALFEQERADLTEREARARELAEELSAQAETAEPLPTEFVEVVRDRRVMSERFDRLQLEAESEVAMFVKPPFVMGRLGNPVEEEILGRGVRVRCLYEASALDSEHVGPYIEHWTAKGEEARLFPGELPCKLALVDRAAALFPLAAGEQVAHMSVLIRNAPLGTALALLFDYLWESSAALGDVSDAREGSADRDAETVDLLRMLAAGWTDQRIAAALGVSDRTVRRRIKRATEAVGAGSRAEAAARAASLGMLGEGGGRAAS